MYYTQGSAEVAIANMKGGKESFYECQYQFAKEWLDFTSVRVTVEGDRWRVSPASTGSLDWIRDSFTVVSRLQINAFIRAWSSAQRVDSFVIRVYSLIYFARQYNFIAKSLVM